MTIFFQPDAAWPTTVSTTTITATTTHHLAWHECNFENEDLCGWQVFPPPPGNDHFQLIYLNQLKKLYCCNFDW